MNETVAERLDPTRASDLSRVLDLQSRWENMRAATGDSAAQLHALQKAFESYRLRLAEYVARYRSEQIPDLSPSGPDRLGAWCRTVRAVVRRAGDGDNPADVVAKALRMADRIAARVTAEPVGRDTPPLDVAGTLRQLDAIIAWCEAMVPRAPSGKGLASGNENAA